MIYPAQILPNSNYKCIECDLSKHYLIRFTESNERVDLFDESLNQVKQTQICHPSENMRDLSTSLLGVFETSFIKINLTEAGKKKYNEYCDPDIVVETPVFNTDFIVKENRGFWVVLIGDINKIIADYTVGDIDTKFKATCIIEHTPMKWNYWHFSIRWNIEKKGFWHKLELNESQRKKLGKRLGHEARATIAKFARIQEPCFSALETVNYCKNLGCNLVG
jgi:hypothetical protein